MNSDDQFEVVDEVVDNPEDETVEEAEEFTEEGAMAEDCDDKIEYDNEDHDEQEEGGDEEMQVLEACGESEEVEEDEKTDTTQVEVIQEEVVKKQEPAVNGKKDVAKFPEKPIAYQQLLNKIQKMYEKNFVKQEKFSNKTVPNGNIRFVVELREFWKAHLQNPLFTDIMNPGLKVYKLGCHKIKRKTKPGTGVLEILYETIDHAADAAIAFRKFSQEIAQGDEEERWKKFLVKTNYGTYEADREKRRKRAEEVKAKREEAKKKREEEDAKRKVEEQKKLDQRKMMEKKARMEAERKAATDARTLSMTELAESTTEEWVKSTFPNAMLVTLMTDAEGKCEGMGFIELPSKEEVDAIMEKEYEGVKLERLPEVDVEAAVKAAVPPVPEPPKKEEKKQNPQNSNKYRGGQNKGQGKVTPYNRRGNDDRRRGGGHQSRRPAGGDRNFGPRRSGGGGQMSGGGPMRRQADYRHHGGGMPGGMMGQQPLMGSNQWIPGQTQMVSGGMSTGGYDHVSMMIPHQMDMASAMQQARLGVPSLLGTPQGRMGGGTKRMAGGFETSGPKRSPGGRYNRSRGGRR